MTGLPGIFEKECLCNFQNQGMVLQPHGVWKRVIRGKMSTEYFCKSFLAFFWILFSTFMHIETIRQMQWIPKSHIALSRQNKYSLVCALYGIIDLHMFWRDLPFFLFFCFLDGWITDLKDTLFSNAEHTECCTEMYIVLY
jgi:hypothetical protein